MLRAEDLMVGDLLTFDECVNDEAFTVIKVTGIFEDTLFAQIDGDTGNDELDYEGLVGIPLTPEILEKNELDFCKIEAEFRQKDTMVIYGREAPFIILDSIAVNYVHELQHALRLCGIEKEIEL